jgi:eukaryotic-like serine/threonine-protein kinase
MIGKTLGHYQIISQLGRGGMGEVYAAEDLSLGRKVALKFLPDAFTGDPERMARFEREARLLASLNHPNIAAIHGLEQSEGKRFIVMELVQGETLEQRIRRGPLPVDETLGFCCQIAEGLEAAHDKGVLHRDLKPANVMITTGDRIKILDFGLAKALADSTPGADASQSPTITEAMTRPGIILGTAAYMSPEQAKGKAVDKRADVWAFGCILYECLAGKRTFEGETVTETLAAILKGEPDWQALPTQISPIFRKVLHRCLTKQARDRWQAVGDVRIELELTVVDFPDQASPQVHSTAPQNRIRLWMIASALCAGILMGATLLYSLRPSIPKTAEHRSPLVHTTIELPKEAPLALGFHIPAIGYNSPVVSLSPDGSYLAYVGVSGPDTIIYLRQMATGEIRPITGTEGAIFSFFSPSGKWLGFLTNDKVKKIPLQGGGPITLCEARTPVLAWWKHDDVIFFTENETAGLSSIAAEGGNSGTSFSWSSGGSFNDVLADGKWALKTQKSGIGGDHADIFIENIETKELKQLIHSGYGARYVAPGYLVFARGGCLMAVSFDAERREVSGEPIPIATSVDMDSLFTQVQAFSSGNGLLAYVSGGDLSTGRLALVDRQGKTDYLDAPARVYGVVDFAPDRKRLAVHVADVQDYIWIYDMERKEGRRLPSTEHMGYPIWRPDGRAIAVTAKSGDKARIVLRNPDDDVDTNSAQSITGFTTRTGSWSPTGKLLAAATTGGIGFISFDSNTDLGKFSGSFPNFGPDGKWIAYTYSQFGQRQIYIRSYPDGKVNRQLSVNGGLEPRWKPTGELFFRIGNRWYSTHVATAPELRWDPPRLAFETDFIDTPGMSYDVTPDGRQLLVVKRTQTINPTRIDILMNWPEAMKRQESTK